MTLDETDARCDISISILSRLDFAFITDNQSVLFDGDFITLMDRFSEKGIPLSVAVIDMD